jgi:hypothetical protein
MLQLSENKLLVKLCATFLFQMLEDRYRLGQKMEINDLHCLYWAFL